MKLLSLNVFGKKVTVEMADLSEWNLHACFYPSTFEIKIDPKSDAKFQSYIHELGHCVWHRVGLNQAHIHPDVQELIVESFATAIEENFDAIVSAKKTLKK